MKTLSKLILSISVLALVACGGGGDQKSTNSNELSGAIKIDGSSTVYPITEAVAEECLNKMSF